ncbi:DMT family transporter [Methylomonas sp. UP202]|uniref:DMT family transporter n=1 Tax=Methylomonas sp. UP202 TaxID=3040943 RepID=UPI00247A6A0F|nr:DMT family transporter [Methylomonas sp. UP202]WGS87081.1 DMT family transporter [Methylomonas sp. UP202]
MKSLSTTSTQTLLGYGLAALAAIGFSAKTILVKLAYVQAVDAVTLLALRMAFSVPFFLVVAFRHRGSVGQPAMTGRDYWAVGVLGLLGYYLSSLLDFTGLQYISAGLERLILFLYPTLVLAMSALWLKKPFGFRELTAVLLSYSGIALVFVGELDGGGDTLWLGAAYVFAGTVSYALYLLGAGQAIARLGAMRFTAYAMLVACAASILQFVLTHPPEALLLPMPVYQLSLAMAIVSTVLPVFMLSAAIRRIGSGHASLVGTIGPVSTLLMAAVFLGEPMTLWQVGGAALVLMGVLSLSVR